MKWKGQGDGVGTLDGEVPLSAVSDKRDSSKTPGPFGHARDSGTMGINWKPAKRRRVGEREWG